MSYHKVKPDASGKEASTSAGSQAAASTVGPARGASNILVARWAMVALLVALVAVFSALIPGVFFTLANAKVILTTQSVLAILSIAMVFPLVVGHFDLSVGANLGISMIAVVWLTSQRGMNLALAAIIAVAISTFIGVLNGTLVTRIGINALISTLGIATILQAVVQAWTGGANIASGIPKSLLEIARGTFLDVPLPVYYMIVIAILAWFFLDHTAIGRYMYAIGGSKEAAKLAGINVNRLTLSAFVVSGFLAGVAGVVTAARIGVGDTGTGPNYLLPAFAAAMLGAAAIKPGVYNVAGTIVAIFTLAVGVTGLQLLGAPFWIDGMFNGFALVIAVGLTRYLQREAL
jgi:ribose transport system permease protein